jgi:hypothetical protein
MVTPLKIQLAVIKAYYSMALKSIKYYAGLAVGKKNDCLFKEIRLLRSYVEILKNFQIIGSTTTCTCCIQGDYTFLLNVLSELTEARIQFGCDNSGSMYYNNTSYPFNYYYDEDNSNLVIEFLTIINQTTLQNYILNLNNVSFTDDCSFTVTDQSPIEVGVVEEVTGIPVTVDNMYGTWDGNITIYEPDGITVLHTLPIPAAIIDDPELIVDEWNDNGPTDWLLLYDGTQYTMLTPFDSVNYVNYIVEFNQYEGGVDSSVLSTTFIPQNFVSVGTRASTELDIPDLFVGSVPAQALIKPNVPDFVPNNTPAKVNITVAPNSFSTTHIAATMNISIDGGGAFGSSPPSNQYFYYNSTLMFSHIGPYANPAALVTDFNNNNGNGFTMTYIGPSPTPNHFLFEIESPLNTTLYNGNTITVAYNALPYPDDVGTFSGGVLPKPVDVTVSDTTNGTIYTITSPSFNSLQDFVNDFNTNAFGYVATIIPFAVSNNIQITAPISTGFAFNGTTLTYSTTGPTYSSTGTYFGGIDTTECTYTLELYDTGNVLVLPVIENTTPTNYPSLADIAADINSNPLNTYLFYTAAVPVTGSFELAVQFPYPFALPQSLTCNTYNGYTFILTINYTSPQYTPYTSAASMMDGGINAYSPNYDISDTVTHRIPLFFTRAVDSYNYPNGSEIENGFIPDFNTNNTEGYTAEFIGNGTPIPELPSTALNDFLTELTTATLANGDSLVAFIDNTFLAQYNAPTSGALPTYSTIINNLANIIVTNNFVPGLGAQAQLAPSYSRIILTSPPTQATNYNGKNFIIQKNQYTLATFSFNFSGASSGGTKFKLIVNNITIANITLGVLPIYNATNLAIITEANINGLGTGFTAVRLGTTITITAPPYTGGGYNGGQVILEVTQNTVNINGNSYVAIGGYLLSSSFSGGNMFSTLIKQVSFIGGVNIIPTKKVRFITPIQSTLPPDFGTGNWQYNGEILSFDLNFGEYTPNNSPLGYLGGIDPTVGELIVDILDTLLNPYAQLYIDLTPQNYQSRQLLVNAFNATNPFPNNFQINLVSPTSAFCNILSPPTSFDYFNNYTFKYSYFYVSPQYTDYVDVTTTFSGGVDPVLTPYEGEFQQGDIGTFVTDNPCEPIVVEQECLSNTDITNIINHIDRIVK